MSNKKMFKEVYNKKINQDDNYQEILKRIENKNQVNKTLKNIFIPIASIIFASFLILININEKKSSQTEDIFSDEINNNQSYTNESSEENNINTSSNQVIKDTSYKELSKYDFINELNIPNDITDKKYREIYIKDNSSKDYIKQSNYQIYYQNSNNNRIINLTFSDKHKLINNYNSNEFARKIIINNQEITIYENSKTYITSFSYKDIYFNIETFNITENEFNNLLKSIIKE